MPAEACGTIRTDLITVVAATPTIRTRRTIATMVPITVISAHGRR